MKQVSVVIPVYGQWNLAKRNIDSLLFFDKKLISEIIVVDDCSPDNNPYHFDKIVCILKNEVNLGYAGTVNLGMKKATSDIILLLDSDAYLISPILNNIISMYESDSALGCVGYRTVDDNGHSTGCFCYEPTTLGFILGQYLENKMEQLSFANKRNIMPYSCSVSFRKACLEEVNYFDQDKFPILDADIDLSMRIHRSCWELLFNANIVLSHSGGNSYKVNYKRVLLFYKSRWQLLKKHGLIKYPTCVKQLVLCRLVLEYCLLSLFAIIRADNALIVEKKKGRRILILEVSNYN